MGGLAHLDVRERKDKVPFRDAKLGKVSCRPKMSDVVRSTKLEDEKRREERKGKKDNKKNTGGGIQSRKQTFMDGTQ